MSKFNIHRTTPPPAGPIKTETAPTGVTFEGAPGHARDAKSELFLLAVTNMVGEKTFYENSDTRDDRYLKLIHLVAREDASWLARFLPWLRNTANMRSASVVGAVEAAKEMAHLGGPGAARFTSTARQLVANSLIRADEPGEALAYYINTYGRKIPRPITRGIADAACRLYTQRNSLKYDTDSKGWRFGNVIEYVAAHADTLNNTVLFKYLVSKAHHRDNLEIPDELTMLVANKALRRAAQSTPQVLLNSTRLHLAGMTWEDVLSLAGSRVDKAQLWEAMIPNMGYMALLRNLRNFDQARISSKAVDAVTFKLEDADEVRRSRQLPLRFLSAYRSVVSSNWARPLERALETSLTNVPSFTGRTLILIDTSPSMVDKMSAKSDLLRRDAAVTFGLALAKRCDDPTVVSFGTRSMVYPMTAGESLLRAIARWDLGGFNSTGGGTETGAAVKTHFKGHDRVVILTDEQATVGGWGWRGDVLAPVPSATMAVTFNLAGYGQGHAPSGTGTRVTIGGLSDAAFSLLPVLEQRAQGGWPF